jgi:predicted alpha/beta-hydrolase family hydrolase
MRRIDVRIGPRRLPGLLDIPEGQVHGLVIFAHGSGSSRLSPRNQFVARQLHARGLATLLFDLLTDDEALDRRNVFDIALLARRLGEAIEWQQTVAEVARLPTGLFGASTGAAAALVAAASTGGRVGAVVSRGGRPDLAGAA